MTLISSEMLHLHARIAGEDEAGLFKDGIPCPDRYSGAVARLGGWRLGNRSSGRLQRMSLFVFEALNTFAQFAAG